MAKNNINEPIIFISFLPNKNLIAERNKIIDKNTLRTQMEFLNRLPAWQRELKI